ncbi:uncharacterized protein Dwil_GK11265 [Drosophila willistoni]|uniref:Uncharacterized protein n=1 Tax=Drosophila willistoni TaxID=7260 RepID=B4NB21_DROWI|nr:uncharacterized protein LOC6648216 [Drosophila willistoni]EDW80985.1 uncharacterized protein Dwil_GK11265 [Drosophila willistoni]
MDAKDIFHDCLSDSDTEHFSDVSELPEKAVGDGSHSDDNKKKDTASAKQLIRFDDPEQIRTVLERAALTTKMLLRCYGGDGQSGNEDNVPYHRSPRFYPATLEINARLHAEETCSCPKNCQCQLRGEPVTLKLPIELNPLNGQVNVEIYQPKSLEPAVPRKCLCDKGRKNRLHCRTVRWSQEENLHL